MRFASPSYAYLLTVVTKKLHDLFNLITTNADWACGNESEKCKRWEYRRHLLADLGATVRPASIFES